MAISLEIISLTLVTGIVSTIICFFTYRKVREQLKHLKILYVSMISGFFFLLSYLLVVIFQGIYYEISLILQEIAIIFLLFLFFPVYIYFERLLNLKPPFKRFIIYSLAFCFSLTITFVSMLNMSIFFNYSLIFSNIVVVMVGIFGIYINRMNLKDYKLNIIKIEYIAMIFIVLASSWLILFNSFMLLGIFSSQFENFYLFFNIANVLYVIAVIFLLINAFLYGNFLFFSTSRVHAIIIYNKGGINVYYKNFISDDPFFEKHEALVSSSLSAFSSFFKDLLGMSSNLEYINAKTYEFVITELENSIGTVVIITPKANYYLKNMVTNFCAKFPLQIFDRVILRGLDQATEKELLDLIYSSFPNIPKKGDLS